MLNNEINEVVHQLESRLGNQGLDLETYLKTRDMDQEGLREEATPAAESRLKRSLVLLEIAQKEEIDVSPDDLQKETERMLDSLTQYMSEPDLKKFSSQDMISNLAGNIYGEMRMNRTLEYLRTVAKGEGESEEEQEDGEESELSQPEATADEPPKDETATEKTPPESTQQDEQEDLHDPKPDQDEIGEEEEISQEGE
jgi:trigger factor